MDSDTFAQQLQDVLRQEGQEGVEILIHSHGRFFPIAAAEVLGNFTVQKLVEIDWALRVVGNLKGEEPRRIHDAFIRKLAGSGQYLALIHQVWGSSLGHCLGDYFCDHKDDLAAYLKELCEHEKTAEIKMCVAKSIREHLFCECVCILSDPATYSLGDEYDDASCCVFDKVYINILRTFSERDVKRAYTLVAKDDRYACRYLATVLAARMRKWRTVSAAVSSGRVVLLRGVDEVFVRAMQCRAWTSAAHVLNALMLQEGVSETEHLLDVQYRAETRLMGKMRRSSILVPFVQRCRQLRFYAAGALYAAWDTRWRLVRSLFEHVQQGSGDNANLVLIEELLRNRQFRPVYAWLLQPSQRHLKPMYVDSILWESVINCKNPQAAALAARLMDQCCDGYLLGQVLYHIIVYCQEGLLTRFFAKDLLRRAEDLDFVLQYAVDIWELLGPNRFSGARESPRRLMLLKCVEAGCCLQLNQRSTLPLDAALKNGTLPVLEIFHRTGAYSNAVFHRVHTQLQNGTCEHKPKRNAGAVLEFLQRVVDSPRSLQNLCCVAVSRMLGLGADRKERALSLGLPVFLTRKILFLDFLYPDSHEEESGS